MPRAPIIVNNLRGVASIVCAYLIGLGIFRGLLYLLSIAPALLLVSLFTLHTSHFALAAPNFAATADDPALAQQIEAAAEHYRRQLSLDWFAAELPDWSFSCPIRIQSGANVGAGGATMFWFGAGGVEFEMQVQGTPVRILDSVLPHEVLHTVLASHVGRALPRWADEGACSTVEADSERARLHAVLIDALKSGRGIPFAYLFAMQDYPKNPQTVIDLYAHGEALVSFLLQHGGKLGFTAFVRDGLADGAWSTAVKHHYGYEGLGTLQNAWLDWVRAGRPAADPLPSRYLSLYDASACEQNRWQPGRGWVRVPGSCPPTPSAPLLPVPRRQPATVPATVAGPKTSPPSPGTPGEGRGGMMKRLTCWGQFCCASLGFSELVVRGEPLGC